MPPITFYTQIYMCQIWLKRSSNYFALNQSGLGLTGSNVDPTKRKKRIHTKQCVPVSGGKQACFL